MNLRCRINRLIPITAVMVLLIVPLVRSSEKHPAMATAASTNGQQDLTFRLINLERQVETLQTRTEFLEQMARNPPPGDAIGASANAQSMIEIQRQMLSLAEQQLLMQTQLLELKKSIDRLSEKNEPLAPKPAPKKPLPQ